LADALRSLVEWTLVMDAPELRAMEGELDLDSPVADRVVGRVRRRLVDAIAARRADLDARGAGVKKSSAESE